MHYTRIISDLKPMEAKSDLCRPRLLQRSLMLLPLCDELRLVLLGSLRKLGLQAGLGLGGRLGLRLLDSDAPLDLGSCRLMLLDLPGRQLTPSACTQRPGAPRRGQQAGVARSEPASHIHSVVAILVRCGCDWTAHYWLEPACN